MVFVIFGVNRWLKKINAASDYTLFFLLQYKPPDR